MRRRMFSYLLSLWFVAPTAVAAQEPSGSPASNQPDQSMSYSPGGRNGWVFGFDAFAGNGLESNASVAAGMGAQVGWMVRPTLALMLDTHGAAVGTSDVGAFEVSSSVRVRAIVAASAQWWPSRRLWLRGGVGPARIDGVTTSVGVLPGAQIEATRNGFGASIATGYEVYRGSLFALDLHLRYAGVRSDGYGFSTILGGVGLAWYPSSAKRTASPTEPRAAVEPAQPEQPRWRDRWIVGLGAVGGLPLGKGGDDRYWDAGAGMAFQVGRMFTPRLALVLDTHGMAVGRSDIQGYDKENNALVQGVVAFAVQYWTSQRLWVKGGLGGGEIRSSATVTGDNGQSVDIIETETGFGTLAAVGYELFQGTSFGVDVQARYAGIYGDTSSSGNLAVGAGLSWYP